MIIPVLGLVCGLRGRRYAKKGEAFAYSHGTWGLYMSRVSNLFCILSIIGNILATLAFVGFLLSVILVALLAAS